MTAITKKGRAEIWIPKFWTKKEESAFRQLKIAMVIALVLQLPDFYREFTMTTNASEVSASVIL